MSYPAGTGTVFVYLGRRDDVEVTRVDDGERVEFLSGDVVTEAAVSTILASAEYASWLAEHGGDPVLTARRQTREALSAAKAESALHRAAFLVLVDEFNRHIEKFTALRDALSTATSLADAKAKAAAIEPIPARTGQDLRDAAIVKIDSGAADS